MSKISKTAKVVVGKKDAETKQMDKMVMGTRNKLIVYYSKIFGNEKTNELINKAFSKSKPIQKIIEAEKMGFETIYLRDNLVGKSGKDKYITEEGVFLRKDIDLSLDVAKYNEKFYNTLKENLLLVSYKKEDVDSIMSHYLPEMYTYLCSSSNLEIPYVLITDVLGEVDEYGNEVSPSRLFVELSLSGILRDTTIEIDEGEKIKMFKQIDGEEILGVFIDSLIQVFGDLKES